MSNGKAAIFDWCSTLVRHALPEGCILCTGASTAGMRFCAHCFATLPRIGEARCRVCALPLTSGEVCGRCTSHPPRYDGVRAPYAYVFPIDALIHAYKYRGELSLAPVLASALMDAGAPQVDALVPMPLSPARLRERGFNQAQELARIIGWRLRLSVLSRACRKVKDTPPQAALEWSARKRNVRGAFVCDADLSGYRVAIVDDVMTTGATLDELARVIKRAGALEVHGWVVARTLRG